PHGMLPLRRRRCNARLSCAVGSYVLSSDLGRPRGPRATLGCKTRRGVTFMNPKQRRQQGAVRPVALYGLGMSLSWGLGVAQQLQPAQPQAEPQLQEVVVTAQKRQQNIQTVPIAISAFTSQQLQQQNVTSLASPWMPARRSPATARCSPLRSAASARATLPSTSIPPSGYTSTGSISRVP